MFTRDVCGTCVYFKNKHCKKHDVPVSKREQRCAEEELGHEKLLNVAKIGRIVAVDKFFVWFRELGGNVLKTTYTDWYCYLASLCTEIKAKVVLDKDIPCTRLSV